MAFSADGNWLFYFWIVDLQPGNSTLKKIYDWVLSLAESKYPDPLLFLLSFAESIFFPIPPDILLMPMCLGARLKAFRFAFLTTAGSLFGASVGYLIGNFLWWDGPEQFSGMATWFFSHVPGFHPEQFYKVKGLYERFDFWIVFVAAFTPIPFKIITISAGAFKINWAMFLISATIGRAGRFFLVAFLLRVFGPPIKNFIDKYFSWLSVLFVILLIGGFLVIKWLL